MKTMFSKITPMFYASKNGMENRICEQQQSCSGIAVGYRMFVQRTVLHKIWQ